MHTVTASEGAPHHDERKRSSATLRIFHGHGTAPGSDPILDDYRDLRTTFVTKKGWRVVLPGQVDTDEYDRSGRDTHTIVVERDGRAAAGARLTRLPAFYGNSMSLSMWQDCAALAHDGSARLRLDRLEEVARKSGNDPSGARLYDITRMVTRYAALPDGHPDKRRAFADARPDTLRIVGAIYGVGGPGAQWVYTVEAGYASFLRRCSIRCSVLFEGVIGSRATGTQCALCLSYADDVYDAVHNGDPRDAAHFDEGLAQVRR
jgi:hypothetical protein